MAIAFVQEAGATTTGSTSTTLAATWGSATTAGNLLIMGVCCGSNSLNITFTPPSGWTLLTAQLTANGGANPAVTGALYYKKNAASESGAKTFTFSSAVWASLFLAEFSGCDVTAPLDQESSATSTGSTNCVTGTTTTTAVANELLVALTACNSNFTQTTPQNSFTLQDTQKSAAAGTARVSGGFLYRIVSATGAYTTGVTLSSSNPNIGKIATFKIQSTGATVQLTSMGSAAGPRQFPLGPPDMTGATTLTDPNPGAVWSPSLTNGIDYILDAPNVRSRQLRIINGRNVYVPKLLITLGTITDGEMVYLSGGDVDRIVHIDTFHLDNNGLQCDAIKTHGAFGGRHLQLRNGRIEKLIGQTSQVHADLIQSSAGIGELWIEDFTGYTTYDGFMLQREANLENQTTSFTVTAASVSGANYVYTAAGHTFVTGDPVAIWNVTPDAYNGGFTVLSTASTTFTCKKGDSSPGALTGNGKAALMSFAYDVGSINFNRVNVKGFHNDLQGTASLQSIRFGARHAPNVNAGNPGTVLGYVKLNEDETPLNIDQWNGTLTATDWYGNPDSGVVGDFVEPDSGTANYSGSRPVQHAGTPAYADWPSHPNVTAGTKIIEGDPPGGDFVVMSGGLPTPTVIVTGAGAGTTIKVNTPAATMSAITASAYPNAYDLFTRSVGAGGLGTANLGGTYTLLGTAADFSVNGTAAVIAVTAAGQAKRATLSSVSMTNQYATGTFQTDTQPAVAYTGFDVFVRFVDTNNHYRCRAVLNPNGTIQLQWEMRLAGSISTLKAAVTSPLTLALNHDYGISASAVGTSPTVLSAHIWDAAAPPPYPLPVLIAVSDSTSAMQVASAAGVGCALNTGSTATGTKVSIADWAVWPTRMQSADCAITVTTANATLGFPVSVSPTLRKPTPRTG